MLGGHLADQGNDFRRPRSKLFSLMIVADISQDERISAAMATVENAAQLVIVRQKSVGFVNQKVGALSSMIRNTTLEVTLPGRESLRHQPVEQVEQDCFAALWRRACDRQQRRDRPAIMAMGKRYPQRDRIRAPSGKTT